jgi:hypothetical protein
MIHMQRIVIDMRMELLYAISNLLCPSRESYDYPFKVRGQTLIQGKGICLDTLLPGGFYY